MAIAGAVVILALSLPCWLGQVISWLFRPTAERWKLTELEADVESVYYGDIRGEAIWDAFTLWTMPLAGLLLLLGKDQWAQVGLVAGGMYVYFAGRGILTRLAIRKRGFRIGAPEELKMALAALAVWGLLGSGVVVAALVALSGS